MLVATGETFVTLTDARKQRTASRRSVKGIANLHPAIENLTVLHVFAHDRLAFRNQRCCDDQRIINRKSVALGEAQCLVMGFFADRHHRAHGPDCRQHFANFLDRHLEPARGHGRELVQDLDADDPAGAQELFGAIGFFCVAGEQVEQNLGIEESLSRAHWLQAGRI